MQFLLSCFDNTHTSGHIILQTLRHFHKVPYTASEVRRDDDLIVPENHIFFIHFFLPESDFLISFCKVTGFSILYSITNLSISQ